MTVFLLSHIVFFLKIMTVLFAVYFMAHRAKKAKVAEKAQQHLDLAKKAAVPAGWK